MIVRALAVGCALFVAVPAAATLSIVKTCPPDRVEAGTGFAYTITVTNGGTAAVSFHLHDALPDEVLFENLFVNGDFPGPETVCQLPTYESNDAPIECDYSGLAPGATVEFTVSSLLQYCLPGGTTVTNSATATAPGDSSVSSQCGFSTIEQSDPLCNDFNACTDYDQCYDGYCVGQPINGCPARRRLAIRSQVATKRTSQRAPRVRPRGRASWAASATAPGAALR
ncbi:MAG TPA: hypothetical protein VFV19_06430 [Candidatus Polarisedimenticolaceae bacterium]|nr:hypothetical protein [Candidatus Polarisedimenticolaceae bacterium]